MRFRGLGGGGSRSRLGHRVALLSATWLPLKHHPFSAGEKDFLSFLSLPRLKKLTNLNRPENQMVPGKGTWLCSDTSAWQWVTKGKKEKKKTTSKNAESHRSPSNLFFLKNPKQTQIQKVCAGNKDALFDPINGNLIRHKIYERHWKRDLFPIRRKLG